MDKAKFIELLRNVLHYRTYAIIIAVVIFALILLSKMLVALKETKDEALEHYDKKAKTTGNLRGMQKRMSQLGIMYRNDNYDLQPSQYLTKRVIVSLLIGVLFFVIGVIVNLFTGKNYMFPAAIAGILIGYFGLEFYYKRMNESDNEDMIMDIYNSYISLDSQISSGQYMGDILMYIYNNSKNTRYKEALKELINNLANKQLDTKTSIDIFQNRFTNPQIKKFCSALNSYYVFGLNNKFFSVLRKEIESIIDANNIKEESSVQTKTSAICFVMFALIVVAGIYCFINGFEALSFF